MSWRTTLSSVTVPARSTSLKGVTAGGAAGIRPHRQTTAAPLIKHCVPDFRKDSGISTQREDTAHLNADGTQLKSLRQLLRAAVRAGQVEGQAQRADLGEIGLVFRPVLRLAVGTELLRPWRCIVPAGRRALDDPTVDPTTLAPVENRCHQGNADDREEERSVQRCGDRKSLRVEGGGELVVAL